MLKKILIGLAAILVIFVIIVALQPNSFNVARSITINADPATVYAQVSDFKAWSAWSPWEKLDPKMQRAYEGPTSGTGAIYKWSSTNDKVGTGVMTMTESNPNEFVKIRLEFTKPFEGDNTAEFTLKAAGAQTVVTWSMYGPNCVIAKVMSVFCSMDKMIGGEFEKGLANLKSVAEATKSK